VSRHECECGRPRAPRSVACDLCRFLDGASPAEQVLIGILRSNGGRAYKETLAEESGWTIRYLQRKLAQLQRAHRVVARHAGDTNGRRLEYVLVDRSRWERQAG
jgi:hypothetical protein